MTPSYEPSALDSKQILKFTANICWEFFLLGGGCVFFALTQRELTSDLTQPGGAFTARVDAPEGTHQNYQDTITEGRAELQGQL